MHCVSYNLLGFLCKEKKDAAIVDCPHCECRAWGPLELRPPLGIMPRKMHREKRFINIIHAIGRLETVPNEWLDELSDLYNNK